MATYLTKFIGLIVVVQFSSSPVEFVNDDRDGFEEGKIVLLLLVVVVVGMLDIDGDIVDSEDDGDDVYVVVGLDVAVDDGIKDDSVVADDDDEVG